jgi:hypothetical protein
MTADDTPETPDPLLNPDGTRKKDLRYSKEERQNVRVERQLDGSGHLARGDKTRMSVLNFSARAQPRTERDPDFAFRPAPPARQLDGDAPASPVPPAAEPVVEPEAAKPVQGSVIGKIKKILGF